MKDRCHGASQRTSGGASWGVRLSWLLAPCFVVFLSSALYAEDRLIHGLSFPVQEFVAVDPHSFKVSVAGKSALVGSADADTFIVSESLRGSEGASRFSLAQLRGFTLTALREGAPVQAAKGFIAVVRGREASLASIEGLVSEILGERDGLEVVKIVCSDPSSELPAEVAAELVAEIGLRDNEWLRSKALSMALRLGPPLRERLQKIFIEAIKQGDAARSAGAAELFTSVFGAEDEQSGELRRIVARVRQLQSDSEGRDVDHLSTMLQVAMQGELEKLVLVPLLVERIMGEGERLLNAGSGAEALGVLSKVPFEARTPRTHELVRRALTGISAGPRSVLQYRPIELFARRVAMQDESVRAAYLTAVEQQTLYHLSQGQLDEVEYYFRKVLLVRPDPAPGNDALRVEMALVFAARGQLRDAEERWGDISTKPSFLDRIRFSLARMYGDIDALLTLALVFIGILVVLRIIDRGVLLPKLSFRPFLAWLAGLFSPRASQQEETQEESETQRPAGFSYLHGAKPSHQGNQEYVRCLIALGVNVDADLKTIKHAYRKAIKDVHPDTQQGQNPAATARFVALTTAYDRLLELRRQFGFKDTE